MLCATSILWLAHSLSSWSCLGRRPPITSNECLDRVLPVSILLAASFLLRSRMNTQTSTVKVIPNSKQVTVRECLKLE